MHLYLDHPLDFQCQVVLHKDSKLTKHKNLQDTKFTFSNKFSGHGQGGLKIESCKMEVPLCMCGGTKVIM